MVKKKTVPNTNLEVQYLELFKQLGTTPIPLPDNVSLAQPSPFKAVPTIATSGIYEERLVTLEPTYG